MRKLSPKKNLPSTREQVLDVALKLFNEGGIDRTTTKRIAEVVGINEGNLYYHFRTKEALAGALLDRMESEAMALLGPAISQKPGLPDGAADLVVYTGVLKGWFVLTWHYRFMFNDMLALVATPTLTVRLRMIAGRLEEEARAVFARMAADGLIVGNQEALDTMLTNLMIVSGHWMSYLALRDGLDTVGPDHIEWGIKQVRSLYIPFLKPGLKISS